MPAAAAADDDDGGATIVLPTYLILELVANGLRPTCLPHPQVLLPYVEKSEKVVKLI